LAAVACVVIALLPISTIKADLPVVNGRAIDAYLQGMRILNSADKPKDLNAAERLFKQATIDNLPHGYYGMACVIYEKADPARTSEAAADLKYAAEHNVLEAKATLATYYWYGIGVTANSDEGRQALLDALQFARHLPSNAFNPRTLYTQEEAKEILRSALTSGMCGPKLDIFDILVPSYLQWFPYSRGTEDRH
jgi:hypothetical protein